jgi:hypothetical protein
VAAGRVYRITIRALRSRVPASTRLKRLLKILLRAFRFRVLDVEELDN